MKRGIAKFWTGVASTVVLLGALSAPALSAGTRMALANGLSVTIYDADYLAGKLSTLDGAPAVRLDDGRYLPVVTDINDPSIWNKGDGTFHPFSVPAVMGALQALDLPANALSLRVYLLPYPRRGILVSSTAGADVFLSPQVLDIDPSVSAYIASHEVGHVFHNRFMPDGSPLWDEYRQIRGIADVSRFNETAMHAYRPKEILAEDFRALFGGVDARMEGRIENVEIVLPDQVAGLKGFFLRVGSTTVASRTPTIVATSYPNPFNPVTEIRVGVPPELSAEGAPVSVRIYSVTGALVRDVYVGRASGDFAVRWDGTDRAGSPVASSTYYAAVQVGDARETVRLVLLK